MSQQEPRGRLASNPDQLNGWKEIADYLGKSTRTVQRWERDYGLPVHRIEATNGEVVFALRREVDQWKLPERSSGSASEPRVPDQEWFTEKVAQTSASRIEPKPREHSSRLVWAVAGFGLLTVAVLISAYAWTPEHAPILSSSLPLTRPQGETYQFRGERLTVGGSVSRWTRVPNGNQETMSSPLIAERDGSVRWGLTTDCRTETGIHVVWMVDEHTKRTTNAVSVVVLRNPECDKPAADLISREVLVDRTSVRPGDKITVTFALWNLGTAPAVPTTTRIRLGTQSARTGPGDRLIADYPTSAIAIGKSRVERVDVVIPSGTAAGVYYLWVVADNGSAIIERNSYNNFARSEALAVLPH